MPNTFLSRSMRSVLISVAASLCLAAGAQAQHGGGGGGHGGGGHFGGGHSGGGHTSHAQTNTGHGGSHHWGWLHFGSRKPSGGDGVPDYIANEFRSAEMIGSANHLPSTYIRTVPLRSMLPSPDERFSTYDHFRRDPGFISHAYRRFPGSSCFFNGFNQLCFFEPGWSLLWFSAGFDWFPFDWGYGDDSGDTSEPADYTNMMSEPIDSGAEEPASNSAPPPRAILGLDLDPRFFLLILKNGAEHVVTDYWLTDGYIEYVSRDGSRSHVPVDALDLEGTVRNNAARGLSFVLRSAQ